MIMILDHLGDLAGIYRCQGFIAVRDLSLSRIYRCQGFIAVRDLSLSGIYRCQGFIAVRDLSLSGRYRCRIVKGDGGHENKLEQLCGKQNA